MKLRLIRSHLGIKLFLTYLIVIIVSVIVLATAAEFAIPNSFNRHLANMGTMMSSKKGDSTILEKDFFTSYHTAVNEALIIASLAASVVAILVSLFVTRQIVSPLRDMKIASQRIASGTYIERVKIRGNIKNDDLDELDQLVLSFNRMAATLEKTEALRSQLIGDVAHELRTPLTTIQGYMEGLMDGVIQADDVTYQAVYNEADRLKHLVNDLQELSRIEAGAYELDRHPTSIKSMTNWLFQRLNQQFNEKDVSLEIDIPEDLPEVLVDDERIDQVLLNLVGNALQYTPAGGKVSISAGLKDNEIQIAITDTGIGLSPEHLHDIFTRFYRVDKSRSRAGGGSGIGLTIAKHIIEAHEGKIWANSLGLVKGSTFIFTLPTVI